MNSLRRTVFFWLSTLLLGTGVITAVVAYVSVTNETSNLLDGQLRQIAYYIGDSPSTRVLSTPQDPSYDPEDYFLVQVWDAPGTAEHSSDPGIAIAEQGRTGFSDTSTAEEDWRTYTRVTSDRTVQVSQRMTVRRELATAAALQSALAIIVLLPVCWFVLGLLIDGALRRLDRLAEDVAQRSATDRRPIPLAGVPSEVAPLVVAMNDLMRRLQAAIDRQRRFVSDAAHELRTPLTALTLQVENLKNTTSRSEMLARVADVEAGTRRASSLVAQLLRLALYESEVDEERGEPVDALAVVRECIAELNPFATQVGTVIEFRAAPVPDIPIRAQDLKILITNILDNAIRHAPSGGRIEIRCGSMEGHGFLTIADNGPGIPDHLTERVFERFFRAAGQEVEGSGLGLAIARSIAERYAMTLVLANRQDRSGLIVTVSFPQPRID